MNIYMRWFFSALILSHFLQNLPCSIVGDHIWGLSLFHGEDTPQVCGPHWAPPPCEWCTDGNNAAWPLPTAHALDWSGVSGEELYKTP